MNYLNPLDLTGKEVARPVAPIKPLKLAVKLKRKIVLIDAADVTAVEAQGNYVLLRRELSSYRVRDSISRVAETLKPHGFIRIHRSVLVNPSFVEEIQQESNGQYSLRIRRGGEYRVTRTYRENLRSIAQLWIGADVSP